MVTSATIKLITLITITLAAVGCATERTFDVPSETVVDAIGAMYDPTRNPDGRGPYGSSFEVINGTKKTVPSTVIHYAEYEKFLIAKSEIKVTPTGPSTTFVRISSKGPNSIFDLFFGPSRKARYERERLAEIEAKLGVAPLVSKK